MLNQNGNSDILCPKSSASDIIFILQSGKLEEIGNGARVKVYSAVGSKYVIKIFQTARYLHDKFSSWGIDLGNVYWSSCPGDSIKTAEELLIKSKNSLKIAEKLLDSNNLIVAPFRTYQVNDICIQIQTSKIRETIKTSHLILQRKVIPLGIIIRRLIELKDFDNLQYVFKKFAYTVISMWQYGVTEVVFNFMADYGITSFKYGAKDIIFGEVVLLDIGELSVDYNDAIRHVKNRKYLKEYSARKLMGIS